jgi:hypothetical protein
MSVSKQVLSLLMDRYPERLGAAFMVLDTLLQGELATLMLGPTYRWTPPCCLQPPILSSSLLYHLYVLVAFNLPCCRHMPVYAGNQS